MTSSGSSGSSGSPIVLVAEDEAPQRRALCDALAHVWPEAKIASVCEDGLDALEAWEHHHHDVAFLDVRMPGTTGLEVARRIGHSTHVVFVTAFDHHAVEAFERDAVDYLLKPVRPERLQRTVARLRERLASTPTALGSVLREIKRARSQERPALKWITASVGDVVRMIPLEDVQAFHAQDKYTRVLLAHDEALIRTSLRELGERLYEEEFWHVHRSLLVRATAIDHVRRDETGKLRLKLRGHDELFPVSPAFHDRFRAM